MKVNHCNHASNALRGNVLIINPERRPITKNMAICLDNFSQIIQGSMEARVYPEKGVAFIYDENWDTLRLPVNRVFFNGKHRLVLHGTFIVVGAAIDDTTNTITFTGLTREQLHEFKSRFTPTVRMMMVDGRPEPMFDLLAK